MSSLATSAASSWGAAAAVSLPAADTAVWCIPRRCQVVRRHLVSNRQSVVAKGLWRPNRGRALPLLLRSPHTRTATMACIPPPTGGAAPPSIVAPMMDPMAPPVPDPTMMGAEPPPDLAHRLLSGVASWMDERRHTPLISGYRNLFPKPIRRLMDEYGVSDGRIVTEITLLLGVYVVWFVVPKVLRRLHKWKSALIEARIAMDANNGNADKSGIQAPFPYENTKWWAADAPLRVFALAFYLSHIAYTVIPPLRLGVTTYNIAQFFLMTTVFAAAWFAFRWMRGTLAALRARARTQSNANEYLDQYDSLEGVGTLGIAVVALVAAGEVTGAAVTSLLALGGVGSVAVGFAGQQVIGNFLAGLMIRLTKPFVRGDLISSGDVTGFVEEIGFHYTRVLGTSMIPLYAPNSSFAGTTVLNFTRMTCREFKGSCTVRLEDAPKVPLIIGDILQSFKDEPKVWSVLGPPRCWVEKITAAGMTLTTTCNLEITDYDEFLGRHTKYMLAIANALINNGAKLEDPLHEMMHNAHH